MSEIGVVVIGRNEGERLHRCISSLSDFSGPIVYVDSGSSDGSVAWAHSAGADVLTLATDEPFTAARGRNAGLERLVARHPSIEFVQFVDGDCEIQRNWMVVAAEALRHDSDVAIVFGRRRERFPQASVYNRLCDLEWDTPIGPTSECGGDAMMRTAPLRDVGGYNPRLIAGEEPELCVRLRAHGWKILRIADEMTLHDAAMLRFRQWWRRNIRNGHAFVEGAALHGDSPERHWVRQSQSNWVWGLILPVVAVALAWLSGGATLLVAAAMYVVLAAKVYRYCRRQGRSGHDAVVYSVFCVLGKFPQAQGQLTYRISRLIGRGPALIEYKSSRALEHS